jgi:RNA polymerase-binding transcription factor DksA
MTAARTADPSLPERLPFGSRPLDLAGGGDRHDVGGPTSESPAWVESARTRLLQQRAFRVVQLEELGDTSRSAGAGTGPGEVRELLRVAAEAALVDVDVALTRIERGTYGRCPRCGESIALARLEAVPSAPLCGACHRTVDLR